jgi:hypothetical protein
MKSMSREIITNWADHQLAIDRLLSLATRKILVFDPDLEHLKLDQPERISELIRVLQPATQTALQIAVRNAEPLYARHPRMMHLLSAYSHVATAQQVGAHLSHLRDAIFLVDDHHGLIRFDQDNVRSKLLIDEAEELSPYLKRFNEIWNEPGEAIKPSVLGL